MRPVRAPRSFTTFLDNVHQQLRRHLKPPAFLLAAALGHLEACRLQRGTHFGAFLSRPFTCARVNL
jgi:hypothetical protein